MLGALRQETNPRPEVETREGIMAMRRRNKPKVVAEDLSTHPGLNGPIVPVEAGADVLANNLVIGRIPLKPDWSPKEVMVPLPLRLWNARCLILNGFANADILDEELKPRKVQRVDDKLVPVQEGQYSSRAWVQLYGSDYTATTLGPFKAVFTLVAVKPLPRRPAGTLFMWWRYFGDSLLNKEFKEKVWGIVPNRLAVIETAYFGKQKAVRLLEEGRSVLRMVWNSARFPHVVEVPQHLSFRTVAPKRTDDGENDGENDVELGAIALKRGDSDRLDFPFDSRDDEFDCDPTSELGKDLKRIDFMPATWQCMLNYGGVVKIYDEHGSATLPKPSAPRGAGTPRPRRRAGRH
jgi:hypothetical protein